MPDHKARSPAPCAVSAVRSRPACALIAAPSAVRCDAPSALIWAFRMSTCAVSIAMQSVWDGVVIDTGRNQLSLYEDGQETLKAVCSTGSGRALVELYEAWDKADPAKGHAVEAEKWR